MSMSVRGNRPPGGCRARVYIILCGAGCVWQILNGLLHGYGIYSRATRYFSPRCSLAYCITGNCCTKHCSTTGLNPN